MAGRGSVAAGAAPTAPVATRPASDEAATESENDSVPPAVVDAAWLLSLKILVDCVVSDGVTVLLSDERE